MIATTTPDPQHSKITFMLRILDLAAKPDIASLRLRLPVCIQASIAFSLSSPFYNRPLNLSNRQIDAGEGYIERTMILYQRP